MTATPPHDDRRRVWEQAAAERAAQRREPSVKRLILNLIVLGLVIAVVSFFAAPLVAFYGIRAAAQASDVQGLAQLIDYDAVRASLRPQLSNRPALQTPLPSIIQDPIGAIRRQFDQTVQPRAPAGPDVETYLEPRALEGLTLGYGHGAPNIDTPPNGSQPSGRSVRPWPRYWSINRARVAVKAPDRSAETLFTFERRGPFEWKLVHIGLPPRVDVAATPTP